eukprot:TRINITY_DN14347_c0_g1_i1.p1 TRINITY_DN14347_c0_g1~~TRINITY_DN14347_c0_g1_i1.p1  ORF type:complete len:495 (+),score=47.06 TRINITY_DN14347_c0_g1_i1:55-1485(+)
MEADDAPTAPDVVEPSVSRWGTFFGASSRVQSERRRPEKEGLRKMLTTIIFRRDVEEAVDRRAHEEEAALHCLTPGELQELAKETFAKLYPDYVPPTTLAGRRANPIGYHMIDHTQAGKVPSIPNRSTYETHKIHGGIRAAFRMQSADEDRRFEFLRKQLIHGNIYGLPRGGENQAQDYEKTYAACFEGLSLAKPGRAVKLSGAISMCNSLLYLSLVGTNLSKGIDDMVTSLSNHPSLTRLNLSGTRLGPEGAASLGEILSENASIRHVDVSLNGIEDEGCEVVCKGVLRNRSSAVNSLNLSTNKIGAKGGHQLSMLIRDHVRLRELVLWRNNLGAKPVVSEKAGFDYMAEVLPQASMLFHIDVGHNNIRPDSIDLLISLSDISFVPSGSPSHKPPATADTSSSGSGIGAGPLYGSPPSSNPSPQRTSKRKPPTRHLAITAGNQVLPDQLRQLSQYYEVTPYTPHSRANTAAYSFK